MKHIINIFKFELLTKLKTKSFLISWFVMITIIMLAILAPSVFSKMSFNPDSLVKKVDSIAFVGNIDGELVLKLRDLDYEVKQVDNIETAKQLAKDEGFKIVEVISLNEYSFYDFESQRLENLLLENYVVNHKAKEFNIDKQAYLDLKNTEININHLSFDGSTNSGEFNFSILIGMVGVFILYFMSLILGTGLGMSVAREKESRTMEILITNTSAKNLILGKVFANVLISFVQAISFILAGFIGIKISTLITKEANLLIDLLLASISVELIAVFLIYIILGTLLYYFLFAAVASIISKMEEYNSAVTPVTLLIVAGFIVSQMSMSDPSGSFAKAVSFVPLFSPFVMMIRYASGTVAIMELLINISIVLLSVIVVALLSIKIYRYGSVNYGNKFKLSAIFKAK